MVAMIFPLLSFPFDETYPFAGIHKTTAQFLKEFSIPYRDLFDAFKGLDPLRLQAVPPGFSKADPHPDEIAHRLVAEDMVRWFKEEKLVPHEVLPRCSSKVREGPSPLQCEG